MKKLLLIPFVALVCHLVQSQDATTVPEKTRPGFFVGISYSYLSLENELHDLTYHSVWYGQDLGTISVEDDELDLINQKTSEIFHDHQLVIEPGMVFLDKSQWYFEGSILFGLSRIKFSTEIDQSEDNHKTVTSDFENLSGGLSLNLRYNFTDRWGLSLMPYFNFSWGKSENIVDSIQPLVHFFVNDLDETFNLGYGRLNLMASYMTEKLVISLGPGFYYAYINRTYTIDRINPETMHQYHDETESSLHAVSFIDACVRVDWTIIEPLTFSLEAAAGIDLFIKTGLRYNF